MMEIFENLRMAFSALMANKLRSSLTMLGIAIGNASVIAMVGVGQGAQKLAAAQFESLGPGVLFISISGRNLRRTIPNARPLTIADAGAIANQVPAVAAVSPEIFSQQLLTYQDKSSNSNIVGVSPEYLEVRNYQMDRGRFINDSDVRRNNRVIILGSQLSEALFNHQNPIGQQVRMKNLSFEVIGVTESKGSLFGTNQDEQALVPLTTMSNQVIGRKSIYGLELSLISVLAKDRDRVETAQFQIANLLRLRHQVNYQDYFRVSPQKAVMETATQTNEGLTKMLAAIASISLFVGGIGVMNIMLVSVTERTQEIGLRKAIGARETDILAQFLIEAVILTLAGSIVGIVVGVGGMILAESLAVLTTSISFPAIILAIGVSGTIGIIFGVFPAQRAAKLDPIVALRR